MSVDIDRDSREKIETVINGNFFVEAGAGSGKTHELVKRMVAMVENGIDIEKICTITFTKAAANEFYARFQEALSKAKSDKAKKALQNIDQCFMGTIDSFCHMILSEHPIDAGIPSDFSVTEGEEMGELYKKEYSKIQQGLYGASLQKKCNRFKNYYRKADEVFLEGIRMRMGCRNAHLNLAPPNTQEPDEAFKEYKEHLLSVLKGILNKTGCEDAKSAKPKSAFVELQENIDTLSGSWNDNLADIIRILKNMKDLRICKELEGKTDIISPYFDDFFCAHISRGKLAWYEVDTSRPPFGVGDLEAYLFNVALDFINEGVDSIARALKEEGKLSFFDSLLYLRDLLREDAKNGGKLIKYIYNRHSYFLIDEFQDTDPLQTEVFFLLTAQKPDPDWHKCIPHPGSLFIVGDPKQSIYRFKNADVASFLRTKALFSDPKVGEVLELTRNFRSSDPMCSWFNKVFTQLLSDDTEIQSKYKEIPLGEKCEYKGTLSGAYKYDITYHRSLAENEDFGKVADIIARIVSNPDITIQDKDRIVDGERVACDPRMVEYRDIMVITPGKTHLSRYMQEFVKRGIPFKAEGKTLFGECPALISLSYLLSAAADPFDKKAVFSALALSRCGITKDEIFKFADKGRSMSPASLFFTLFDEKMVAARAGTENLEYVYYAGELLREAEISGEVLSLKAGATFVRNLIESPGQERCLQLRQESNRVHLANLHKVKGLEAPVVILADPGKKKTDAWSSVDYSGKPPKCYVFSLGDSLKSDQFKDQKEKEESVLASEVTRLQYVAATRAANAIIVSALHTSSGLSENNIWNEFLPYVDQTIDTLTDGAKITGSAEKKLFSGIALYNEAEEKAVFGDRVPENPSFEIKRPSGITVKGKTAVEEEYDDAAAKEEKATRSKEEAAMIGTMVHRIMEVLVSSGNKADRDKLIAETIREYGADSGKYTDMLKKVVDQVRAGGFTQTGSVPEDILKELLAADEVHCELPFCYNEGDGTIWNGTMDVVYQKAGKWYIVDYKTNLETDDLDVKYQGQLEAYKKAFKAMIGEDAEAVIYHIPV